MTGMFVCVYQVCPCAGVKCNNVFLTLQAFEGQIPFSVGKVINDFMIGDLDLAGVGESF